MGGVSAIVDQALIVRQRLTGRPDLLKLPSATLEIYAVRHFLGEAECCRLIDLIDEGRQPSALLAENPEPEFRTSESCDLDPRHPVVATIEKIAHFTGIHPGMGETIQGQRYDIGQQFRPHHDFFYIDQPYWPEQERSGGQWTWTAMAFLSEPEEGTPMLSGTAVDTGSGALLIGLNAVVATA